MVKWAHKMTRIKVSGFNSEIGCLILVGCRKTQRGKGKGVSAKGKRREVSEAGLGEDKKKGF